ncbi:MAG: carbon-nitrogen hydrolase family protein [Planctomycetota bacterium]|nr:carbon-nitrogen hydrolase family protein [Planctomycetota bacterium]
MKPKSLRIGLASSRHPETINQGVRKIIAGLKLASSRNVDIVCLPETYLPGLRGLDFDLPPPDQQAQESALEEIRSAARRYGVATIVGMEWMCENGLENRAFVVSAAGRILGHQTKNQITPGGESDSYVPNGRRKVFTVKGVRFGIVLCHEGWRYPETVRLAAVRGAQVVFQPQVTGSDRKISYPPEVAGGEKRRMTSGKWGESFYEKAMICRAQENTIYFASVNTAMRFQNSATSVIDPSGKCLAYVPYGKEKLLTVDIDLSKANRFYAKRYDPTLYSD